MSGDNFFYPQKMGRIIFLGLEEVIGKSGVNTVLRFSNLEEYIDNYPRGIAERSFPFERVSLLQSALEQVYGPRGGRGLALRAGRSCFKYGLKEYGSMMGITEMAFRLLPLPTKLHTGAQVFAELFNKHTDQHVRIEETETQIFWHIECCPLCWERTESEPVCHLAVGLIQESLYWLSGGKIFNVEEISCVAQGNKECVLVIDRDPVQ